MTISDRLPREGDEQIPYYAAFRHPDSRWYRLWMTHTQPKTGRGHPWHVHASYDLQGTTEPSRESGWFNAPYGISNWDFNCYEDAIEEFMRRFQQRIDHGYTVQETNLTSSRNV